MHKREVYVSKILPLCIINELHNLGCKTVPLEPTVHLSTELRYHPDILRFRLSNGEWLSESNSICLADGYPNDCVFNCVALGDKLIYGNPYIAENYGNLYKDLIQVRQGYVKCSVAVLKHDAVITSDVSIKKSLEKTCDILLVTNEGISLGGYSCGFFGGCTGVFDKTLFITGNVKLHRDCNSIISFANNHGFGVYSLANEALYDYGGILPDF